MASGPMIEMPSIAFPDITFCATWFDGAFLMSTPEKAFGTAAAPLAFVPM